MAYKGSPETKSALVSPTFFKITIYPIMSLNWAALVFASSDAKLCTWCKWKSFPLCLSFPYAGR